MPSAQPKPQAAAIAAAGGSMERIRTTLGDQKAVTKLLKNKNGWGEFTKTILDELAGKDAATQKQIKELKKEVEKGKQEYVKTQKELAKEKQDLLDDFQNARKEKAVVEEQISALEEEISSSKEQIEFLTKELAEAESKFSKTKEIEEAAAAGVANAEAEAAKMREAHAELEKRSRELEEANFKLLQHTEKQQKDLSKLMDTHHQTKEALLHLKADKVRMENALADARQRITEMADIGKRFAAFNPAPKTPEVASGSHCLTTTSTGNRVFLEPLRGLQQTGGGVMSDQEPDVSPVSGYSKWAKYYGIPDGKTKSGGETGSRPLKQSFVEALCESFGCVVRGWRQLNAYSETSESLTLEEFSHACRELGLVSASNVKMTFRDVVGSFTAKLRLQDLDQEGYRILASLRLRLQDIFHSPENGIRQMFGPKESLPAEDFVHCVEHIKVPKARRLMKFLQMGGRVYADACLTAEECISYQAQYGTLPAEALVGGLARCLDPAALPGRGGGATSNGGASGTVPGRASYMSPQKKFVMQDYDAVDGASPTSLEEGGSGVRRTSRSMMQSSGGTQRMSSSDNNLNGAPLSTPAPAQQDANRMLEQLKRVLVTKYRSLSGAWRQAFDAQGRGHCGSQEFGKVCRALGFEGANTVWREVIQMQGKGLMTFADLDPAGARLVATFRARLVDKYRDLVTAWCVGLDVDGSNRVTIEEFVGHLTDQEGDFQPAYSEAESRQLFKLMHVDGKKYLRLHDIDVKAGERLLNGHLPPYIERMKMEKRQRVNLRAASRERTSAFLERQKGHEIQNLRAEIAQRHRAELSEKDERRRSFDMGAANKEEFLSFLRRKWGNIPRAWRSTFDRDGNGKVSQQEFFSTCRELKAFIGDIGKLFAELDGDGSGLLSLAELDPSAWRVLESFEEGCLDAVKAATGNASSPGASSNGSTASGPAGKWWSVFFLDQNIHERHIHLRSLENSAVTATILKIDFAKFLDICQKRIVMAPTLSSSSAFSSPAQEEEAPSLQEGGQTLSENQARRLFKYFAKEDGSGFLTEQDFEALDIPKMREKKRLAATALANAGVSRSRRGSASSRHNEGKGGGAAGAPSLPGGASSRSAMSGLSSANRARSDISVPQSASDSSAIPLSASDNSCSAVERGASGDGVVENKAAIEPAEAGEHAAITSKPSDEQVAVGKEKDSEEESRTEAPSSSASASGDEEEDMDSVNKRIGGAETTSSSSAEEAEDSNVAPLAFGAVDSASRVVEAEDTVEKKSPAPLSDSIPPAIPSAPAAAPEDLHVAAPSTAESQPVEDPTNGNFSQSGPITDVDDFCAVFVDFFEGDCSRAWSGTFGEDCEEVRFVDFCKGVRKLKFQGNLKTLWAKMGGSDVLCPDDLEEKLFF